MRLGLLTGFGPAGGSGGCVPPAPTDIVPYDLRNHLELIETAYLNTPDPETGPPYLIAYLISSEILTNDGVRQYDFRIECVSESFVEAQALADQIRLYADWPWPVAWQSEKDEYQAPSDAGDTLHILSVHLQIVK